MLAVPFHVMKWWPLRRTKLHCVLIRNMCAVITCIASCLKALEPQVNACMHVLITGMRLWSFSCFKIPTISSLILNLFNNSSYIFRHPYEIFDCLRCHISCSYTPKKVSIGIFVGLYADADELYTLDLYNNALQTMFLFPTYFLRTFWLRPDAFRSL
jgi:hypothetical protein